MCLSGPTVIKEKVNKGVSVPLDPRWQAICQPAGASWRAPSYLQGWACLAYACPSTRRGSLTWSVCSRESGIVVLQNHEDFAGNFLKQNFQGMFIGAKKSTQTFFAQSFSTTLRVMDVRAENRGRPHQKVRFPEKLFDPWAFGRNVRRKSGPKVYVYAVFLPWSLGHTPSTAETFLRKFRKNSGETPQTLSELFLEFPWRVRLGSL